MQTLDLESRTFEEGEMIIEEGEPAMEAYLIETGRVKVTVKKDNFNVEIAQLSKEEIFGESALFKGSDYGATVTALGPTTVIPITPDVLDSKIDQCDPLIRAVMRMLIVRLRKTNALLTQ